MKTRLSCLLEKARLPKKRNCVTADQVDELARLSFGDAGSRV
ncbi:hypothetical protein [Mesorhizobium sp. WSM3860]|nr:hypothetical protein [Mesorhizobium sp. WSM3860]